MGLVFYFLIYIFLCFLIGYSGKERKIGFGISFLVSLFLTPLVGFILTILSSNKAQAEYYETLNEELKKKNESIVYDQITRKSAELKRLQELRNSGKITFDEWKDQKNKLMD